MTTTTTTTTTKNVEKGSYGDRDFPDIVRKELGEPVESSKDRSVVCSLQHKAERRMPFICVCVKHSLKRTHLLSFLLISKYGRHDRNDDQP